MSEHLEYDSAEKWIVATDEYGASAIVARDVPYDYAMRFLHAAIHAKSARLAAIPASDNEGLDAAWKAAEAALPEGWVLVAKRDDGQTLWTAGDPATVRRFDAASPDEKEPR